MDAARYAALFQAEACAHVAECDAALLALEDALHHGADVDATAGHVVTLFRAVHTIKGMAGSMGHSTIETLSHAVESRCEPLRRGEEAVSADLLGLLFESTDLLRGAIDDIARGVETPHAGIGALLERLRRPMAPAEGVVPGAPAHAVPASADPLPVGADVRHVDVRLVHDCPLKGVRATIVLARVGQHGDVRATHPEQTRWQDEQFDGVFRITLVSDADEETLVQAVLSAGDVAGVEVRVPTVAMHVARQAAATAPAPDAPRMVRIDAQRLDTLLDLVGELVITRDRLLRAVEAQEHPDREVHRAARDAARLVSALQDEVLQSRLLPVGDVFDRFQRLVRDVTRELGKEVSFVMEGREIELDRSLLDALGDPLLHLLRNALDHGIEDAATRKAAGKSARGELVLRAARDRAAVIIQVQDDGRGIHRATVLQRAKEQGLVAEAVTELTADMLLQVIAHPGFSTARRVTHLSGRGVGVDVVNTRVRALGGQLELESMEGVGTVVTLRLPVALAITRALLVEVCGSPFAIPATHIEEALEYHESLLVHHATGPAVTIRDEVVPLVALGERFGLLRSSTNASPSARAAGTGAEQHLAIVEAGGRRVALLVDALVAQQDIVVKPLDAVCGAAPWFSGATVLGDGSPALIIDVQSVV